MRNNNYITKITYIYIYLNIHLIQQQCHAMKIRRPWTTKHWCQSVITPEWPFAYSKYKGQIEETKGRVSSNKQDVRHICETQGVQSKCHICEDIQCGGDDDDDDTDGKNKDGSDSSHSICHFQLQGVAWDKMSQNIPTVTDIPWAVGGSHRYDFGGVNTSHVCMYMSGHKPCQSHLGGDYSSCIVRCWGYIPGLLSGHNNTVGPTSNVANDHDHIRIDDDAQGDGRSHYHTSWQSNEWPNLDIGNKQHGLNATPWVLPEPTATWSYPKSDYLGKEFFSNIGPNMDILPQGFSFTLAGSSIGKEGFVDGLGSDARYV